MDTPTSKIISIAKTLSIRDAGHDEFWLRDQICASPSVLDFLKGEGELEVIAKEKIQSTGRRLDVSLKYSEDDTMLEVELMLGATDETHIIRTIGYWDNKQRKYPQRQHFAVLVAETFDRDFFNVIYRFSHSIPIIAIQVNLIEVAGQQALHFSKIIDTYEEPEDSPNIPLEEHDETYWQVYSAWTLEAANALLEIIKPVFPSAILHYVKYYIAIEVDGNNYIWLSKRGGNKTELGFWFSDKYLPQVAQMLDEAEISYTKKSSQNGQMVYFTNDSKALKNHAPLMLKLAEIEKMSWEE
jgi:hypothetical protein